MPQKKAKKAKIQTAKKPAKPAAKGGASVLKKAAKIVAKKVTSALVAKKKPEVTAKKAPVPAVLKKLAKPEKKAKEKEPLKKPSKPAGKEKTAALVSAPGKAKEKPQAKGAVPPKGLEKDKKKKNEVVLEVPAPKGVALLGREGGKKKSRSAEAAALAKRRCREPGCENDHVLSGYCRLHYIKNWRKIKRKEAILASGQLNNYVEELVNKYPDKYLDVIRQDLASEKDWAKVVVDLELESSDEEGAGDEDLEGVAEGVRRDRDFDDDTDSF